MVVGTRVVSSLVEDGSQMDYFFTWGNIAVGTLLRLRFWHPQFLGAASLSDVGCTYRAIRRDALERILPDLVVGANHFSPHMLLVALYRGLSLVEIPVTLRRRIGVSKGAGRSFWAGLRVGLVMIWHILTYSPGRTGASVIQSTRESLPAARSGPELRVLFLVSRDIRHPSNTGGDIGLWERAQYLAGEGHQVTVMASTFPGAPSQEIIDGIHVVRMGGLLSLWWRTFVFYMTKCRGKFDVVVVEGFGGSRIPRFTPLYVKEPIVTEWHQIHAELFAVQYPKVLVPALNFLERLTAFVHRNTVVMARTREWQEAFPRIGFKPQNIRVVPACISEDWLSNGNRRPVKEPRVVWLGKFRRYKCPDHAIRAMRDVVRELPRAKLILAGHHDDRRYEAALEEQVDALGMRGVVEFRFEITEEEKRSLLDSCRAMVLPSSVEGFGIVVLEANARGVPVIASSGVPQSAVQEAVNGLRYDFGRIAELSQKLIEILTDDDLYLTLSANSVAFASTFSWRTVCSQYQDVLKSVAADLSSNLAAYSNTTP
jgi:glycosyltransferase involved in cell wall biosynthesis